MEQTAWQMLQGLLARIRQYRTELKRRRKTRERKMRDDRQMTCFGYNEY